VPCETRNIVESKSFKLYLNSFNNSRFADAAAVQALIRQDLSEAVWRGSNQSGSVGVKIILPEMFDREPVHELDGLSLDRLDIECTHNQPSPELLKAATHEGPVTEVLVSNLLKSNCLVTGQPDWASVLQYLVSFRNHNEFHEQCVERIFTDIWRQCRPSKLSVYARYTRRGGLDINPFRTSHPGPLPANTRHARQ
jgi:7-cyano-7-deazaguanine reductase